MLGKKYITLALFFNVLLPFFCFFLLQVINGDLGYTVGEKNVFLNTIVILTVLYLPVLGEG